MNRLTVVTVNYNSKDYLARCLESLQRHTQGPFQSVVVDNASQDRDFTRLKRRFPAVQFLLNEKNLGFSAGCNRGIRACPARYYLLLNPDCHVEEGALDRCCAFLEAHPQAGIVGCRINHPDGTLQLACRRSIPRPRVALARMLGLSLLFPRNRSLARYNLTYLDPDQTHQVEAVSGSFLMFRHELLESSGWMDEQFFLYGEDLDFCYRAAQKGWEIYYFPEAQAVHHKGRSAERDPGPSLFHYYNSMEIFYRKHFLQEAGRVRAGLVIASIRLLYALKRWKARLSGRPSVTSAQ